MQNTEKLGCNLNSQITFIVIIIDIDIKIVRDIKIISNSSWNESLLFFCYLQKRNSNINLLLLAIDVDGKYHQFSSMLSLHFCYIHHFNSEWTISPIQLLHSFILRMNLTSNVAKTINETLKKGENYLQTNWNLSWMFTHDILRRYTQ